MNAKITTSEWQEIQSIIETGLPAQVGSGDEGHIEAHNQLANFINHMPSIGAGKLTKTTDEEWEMDMGDFKDAGPNDAIDGMFSQLGSMNQYAIVPDSFTTAAEAPIGTVISLRLRPSLGWAHINNYGELMTRVKDEAERTTTLEASINDLTARIEALENPA